MSITKIVLLLMVHQFLKENKKLVFNHHNKFDRSRQPLNIFKNLSTESHELLQLRHSQKIGIF